MQFSMTAFLALAPFLAGMGAAVPLADIKRDAALSHDQVNDVVKHLDSNGKLEWHEVPGGRITSITHEQGLNAIANTTSTRRRSSEDQGSTPTGWFKSHSWTGVAELAGFDTKEACIGTGDQIVAGSVTDGASKACNAFFSRTAAGVTINNGWNVFQQTGIADVSGANSYINWRWGYLGSTSNVKFTETLCNAAAQEILSGPCVSNGITRGASIEVAKNLGFIFGFDPNSA